MFVISVEQGIMNKKNKEDIYYCFKFRCKRCPYDGKCEKEAEKERKNNNEFISNNNRNNMHNNYSFSTHRKQ